jgi:hypothetical protein
MFQFFKNLFRKKHPWEDRKLVKALAKEYGVPECRIREMLAIESGHSKDGVDE